MPGPPRESLLKIPQVVKSVFSNSPRKAVASKIKPATQATTRFVNFSQGEDNPEGDSGLVAIDLMNRPSNSSRSSRSSSAYENLESLESSSIDLDALLTKLEDKEVWERLVGDQLNFYSEESVLGLGLAFGAGALIANTSADVQLQSHFQSSVRGASSDEWFQFLHSNKELGNGVYPMVVPNTSYTMPLFHWPIDQLTAVHHNRI